MDHTFPATAANHSAGVGQNLDPPICSVSTWVHRQIFVSANPRGCFTFATKKCDRCRLARFLLYIDLNMVRADFVAPWVNKVDESMQVRARQRGVLVDDATIGAPFLKHRRRKPAVTKEVALPRDGLDISKIRKKLKFYLGPL